MTRRALRERLPLLVVIAGFVASRVLYAELGITLEDDPLRYFWQYLERGELETNLLEAVYYQHTQPPLFNLYLGLGLKTARPLLFFRAGAFVLGLVLHLSLFALARRLGVRAWLAALASLTFAFNPASILMECWLFYEHAASALIMLSAALLHRAIATERGWTLFFALLAMALVVLTRSLFHLGWMLAAIVIVLMFSRRRLRALAIALVPLALASSVYVKNWVVFGRPVASTWMGFSLSRLTTTKLNPMERDALMREGVLSELADDPPWLPLGHYPRERRALPEGWPEVRVLTTANRSPVHPNFNHGAYVAISETYAADARVVLERVPEVWWESTKHAWTLHFLPIHDYTFFEAQRRRAGPWMRAIERVYERLAGSGFAEWEGWDAPPPPVEERPGWAWAVITGLALLVALVIALKRRRATGAALLFCVFTITWVAVVGNSLEVGENQRFRFLSEPLMWVLAALVIDRALVALGAMRRRLTVAFRSRRRAPIAGR